MFVENFCTATGSELVIIFRNGTHEVWDAWEMEVYGDAAQPLFSGHYNRCLAFVRALQESALEALY